MSIVVIGGHSRSVGKTSVVAGLISALNEFNWTASKITQHGHGICSADGEPCHCATDDHSFAISEEKDPSGGSDTSRFLAAGAVHVWWVRTQQGKLAEAMPAIRKRLDTYESVIIESNSIMRFVRPDFKSSAQHFLDLADAVVLHDSLLLKPAWDAVSLKPVSRRPMFRIRPPNYVTPDLVEFVRRRLSVAARRPTWRTDG
jgi:hypothetical protein